MNRFESFTGIAAPFGISDVDTDKLIPHRYLRKPLSEGYRNFLFHDLRFTPEGDLKEDFILHREPYTRAQILVGGSNFGCGSAREAAVYALYDFGFRAVIAPSFADVFKSNCLQNGLLPIELPKTAVDALCAHLEANPGAALEIDLEAQSVTSPTGEVFAFEIDPSRKLQLLEGLDDIGLTLKLTPVLESFETRYLERTPWLYPALS